MPELPEVETTKNELSPHVVGRRVTGVTVSYEGMVRGLSLDDFRSRLVGQTITGLSRRAKYLLFALSGGETLVIHLKMSGALLLDTPGALEKFIRAEIHLDGNKTVFFRDPRKFARMALVRDVSEVTGKLGPEPLERSFTPELLAQRLRNRKAPVKPVLLDQGCVAGLGNMYADEALFAARIHPLRPANSLTDEDIERLYRAIRGVLRLGVKNKGASEVTYFRPGGEMGNAFNDFKVAHRRDAACPDCGHPIEYVKLRGRGTYFCPQCQKER